MEQLEVFRVEKERQDDRFSRFELIRWWDQERLARAKILVIGAGALGNEILKNLALLGVGNIIIVDMDSIEHSNLSRSVLFRETDLGRAKAEVAAVRAKELFPSMNIMPICANAVSELGLGWFYWADVIIGGLDNREARLSINRNAFRAGKPWIDGAIEILNGVARVFMPPDGPCYECTMSEVDWKMLYARRACSLLNRDEMLGGKTPTTPTVSSIIAGVQCQEAVKILHGMPSLAGKGFIFEGVSYDGYVIEYKRKEDCYSHDTYPNPVPWPEGADGLTLAETVRRLQADMGPDVQLELKEDVLVGFTCPQCGTQETSNQPLGRVREKDALCRTCGITRMPELAHSFTGTESFAGRTLAGIGVPPYDVIVGRVGQDCRYYLLAGDLCAPFLPPPGPTAADLTSS